MFGDVLLRVLPLFLVVLVGYIASRWSRFSGSEPALNAFVFYIALPALLFQLAAQSDISAGVPLAVPVVIVLAVVVFAASLFVGLWLSSKRNRRNMRDNVTTTMSASYGNVSYLGVPIVVGVLGEAGGLAASMGQLFHNLIFMVGYPIVIGLVLPGDTPKAARWSEMNRTICRALFLNPVIWGVTLGLVVSATNWTMPGPATTFTNMLAGAAAPGALFAIGLSLQSAVQGLRERNLHIGPIGIAAIAKLALLPATTALFIALIAPDLPYVWQVSLILMAGMPTSATAFVLAQADNGDGKRTAAVIVLTNASAILTLPLVAQVFIAGS